MHESVLLNEVIDGLKIKEDGFYLDVTGGYGGHSEAILKRLGDRGRLFVSDQDADAFEYLKNKFASDSRVRVVRARFDEVFEILAADGIADFDGITADLGISSVQLGSDKIGIGFNVNAPLDMRLDSRRDITAADIIDKSTVDELADIIFYYGEERHSRKIARALKHDRDLGKINTTEDLKVVAQNVLGRYYRHQKIHPATRLFQALRIAVNEEIDEIKFLLGDLKKRVREEGRVAIISFHSIEDREVKRAFVALKDEGWKIITKKPLLPTEEEVEKNPRSRSAKLRVVERCGVESAYIKGD